MTAEVHWLALTLLATSVMAFPYVLNRIAVRGLVGAMANPSPTDKPQSDWANRAQRAHANAVENLVVFAPAVFAVQATGTGNNMTALACTIYFFARLTHYVVYAAGIPGLRTLSYAAGLASTIYLILRALGWA